MTSKVQEMPDFLNISYVRPDIDAFRECVRKVRFKLMTARDVDTASLALFDYEKQLSSVDTSIALCNILHDLDTSNEYYTNELSFCDEAQATISELASGVLSVMLNCPCADKLKEKYGEMIFRKAINAKETISSEIIEDLVKESNLENEYSQIQSEAEIKFMGKSLNLSMLEPYLESTDRTKRISAHKALDNYYMSKGKILTESTTIWLRSELRRLRL